MSARLKRLGIVKSGISRYVRIVLHRLIYQTGPNKQIHGVKSARLKTKTIQTETQTYPLVTLRVSIWSLKEIGCMVGVGNSAVIQPVPASPC